MVSISVASCYRVRPELALPVRLVNGRKAALSGHSEISGLLRLPANGKCYSTCAGERQVDAEAGESLHVFKRAIKSRADHSPAIFR